MKRNAIVEIICSLFILLFLYTGLIKLITYQTFKSDILQFPFLPKSQLLLYYLPKIIGLLLPLVEIGVSFLLFIPSKRNLGLTASLILMIVFTTYVAMVIVLIPHSKQPCTCGGILRVMKWPQHLIFNIIFTYLALAGVKMNNQAFKQHKDRVANSILT